jgi:hypothetical protein
MAYLLIASAVSNLDGRVVHGILGGDAAPYLAQVRNQGNVRLEDRLVKQRVCATNLPGRDENRQDEVNCFTGDFVCVRVFSHFYPETSSMLAPSVLAPALLLAVWFCRVLRAEVSPRARPEGQHRAQPYA